MDSPARLAVCLPFLLHGHLNKAICLQTLQITASAELHAASFTCNQVLSPGQHHVLHFTLHARSADTEILNCLAVEISREIFRSAVAVVIAHAVYLPSVQCFSLLPVASTLQRTGADTGAALDYDIDNACVTLTAQRTIRYVMGVH